MKTLTYCKTAVIGTAMLALVGCGNNSTNQSNDTNSPSGVQPSTNSMMNNNPVAGMTNASIINNVATTNLPTSTNQ
jgi:hypothetical protein